MTIDNQFASSVALWAQSIGQLPPTDISSPRTDALPPRDSDSDSACSESEPERGRTRKRDFEDGGGATTKAAKRARRRQGHHTFPSSPPLTMPSTSSSLKRPAAAEFPPPAANSRSASPNKRSRSSSPIKRAHLGQLDKPVQFLAAARNWAQLPDDLGRLYKKLQRIAIRREGIMPNDIRGEVVAIEGEDQVCDQHFRGRRPAAETTASADSTSDATTDPAPPWMLADAQVSVQSEFQTLNGIVEDAEIRANQGHDELSWNNDVHSPLLKTVFSSKPAKQSPHALILSVMTAGLLKEYLPTTTTTAGRDPETESNTTANTATEASDSKKVDYTICLDLPPSSPLFKVLSKVAKLKPGLPHINATVYPPLQWCPIAVTVETKVSGQDAMPQLATWAASWHNRMLVHREYIFRHFPDLKAGQNSPVRIPSTLLLEVQGHDWKLYFAVDRGEEIHVFGPIQLGNTLSLVEIYSLTSCLKAVKGWIEESFREQIETWFFYDQIKDIL